MEGRHSAPILLMCGIAGILSLGGASPSEDVARRMSATLTHRGPDSSGTWRTDELVFGHNRLKIIDTSEAGHQPMPNEDETVWLNYNGEIYNYRELRVELERLGHRFRSQTDTEVLVHAYEEWGDDCLRRCNGMFAFALWDKRRSRLFCGRDRLGVKPFYHVQRGGLLYFASEIKALLAALPTAPHPNEAAIASTTSRSTTSTTERTRSSRESASSRVGTRSSSSAGASASRPGGTSWRRRRRDSTSPRATTRSASSSKTPCVCASGATCQLEAASRAGSIRPRS